MLVNYIMALLVNRVLVIVTARGSDGSMVFSIVAKLCLALLSLLSR